MHKHKNRIGNYARAWCLNWSTSCIKLSLIWIICIRVVHSLKLSSVDIFVVCLFRNEWDFRFEAPISKCAFFSYSLLFFAHIYMHIRWSSSFNHTLIPMSNRKSMRISCQPWNWIEVLFLSVGWIHFLIARCFFTFVSLFFSLNTLVILHLLKQYSILKRTWLLRARDNFVYTITTTTE